MTPSSLSHHIMFPDEPDLPPKRATQTLEHIGHVDPITIASLDVPVALLGAREGGARGTGATAADDGDVAMAPGGRGSEGEGGSWGIDRQEGGGGGDVCGRGELRTQRVHFYAAKCHTPSDEVRAVYSLNQQLLPVCDTIALHDGSSRFWLSRHCSSTMTWSASSLAAKSRGEWWRRVLGCHSGTLQANGSRSAMSREPAVPRTLYRVPDHVCLYPVPLIMCKPLDARALGRHSRLQHSPGLVRNIRVPLARQGTVPLSLRRIDHLRVILAARCPSGVYAISVGSPFLAVMPRVYTPKSAKGTLWRGWSGAAPTAILSGLEKR